MNNKKSIKRQFYRAWHPGYNRTSVQFSRPSNTFFLFQSNYILLSFIIFLSFCISFFFLSLHFLIPFLRMVLIFIFLVIFFFCLRQTFDAICTPFFLFNSFFQCFLFSFPFHISFFFLFFILINILSVFLLYHSFAFFYVCGARGVLVA